ncbi:MAG: hypothetical protein M0D55_18180 [Elusimicrobiota bacterium]|nr:MAG: hypothetical protein M0D55_18180 [Elusimicrobiota bacterium]
MIRLATALALASAPSPVPSVSAPASPSLAMPAPASLTPSLAPSLAVPVLPASPVPVALAPVAAAASTPERPNPLGQLRRTLVDWVKPGVAADAEAAPSLIVSYVLDLDGNAFGPGFPTRIILFNRTNGTELAVPTAHFAVIEKKIGSDFVYGGENLADYELRGAASFREFMGDRFAADLKYAVENLPPSEWQGPSWGAMVRALSDPKLAERMYVLTARQHSSEQLLDGFRYLQSAGYIRYLPKVENLHGVGGTYRTAERKAELMAEFADSLQAAAPAEDGGPHTIGFSDDTWENYEKMREALTAAIRREPGRWSRVKIVLFFTGSNTVLHPPEAVVLNADGTTRPYVPNEPR